MTALAEPGWPARLLRQQRKDRLPAEPFRGRGKMNMADQRFSRTHHIRRGADFQRVYRRRRRRQQNLQVKPPRIHGNPAILVPRPQLLRPVPIQLHPVLIRIAQIRRVAHSMVGRAIQPHPMPDQPLQRRTQVRPRRIQNRHVIQPRRPRRRRLPALALPRIQPNVVVVPARRNKRRLLPKPLHQRKPQHPAVKLQRTLKVRHLQMHMPNSRSIRYRHSNPMITPGRHGILLATIGSITRSAVRVTK